MARASWLGSRVSWFQRSAESPALLVVLHKLFQNGVPKLKETCSFLTDDELNQLLAYSAGVFNNCGNFKSFGDTKFVPELSPTRMRQVIESYNLQEIWEKIEKEVYCEEDPVQRIAFRDDNGQTSYYTSNVTSKDAKFVDEFCQANNISPLNTRLFKLEDGSYDLKICSVQPDIMPYLGDHDFNGSKIKVSAADFSAFMRDVVSEMQQAL